MYDKEKYMTYDPKKGCRTDPFKRMIMKSKLSANVGVYGGNNPSKMAGLRDENGNEYNYHNPKLDPKTGLRVGTKKHMITADDLEILYRKQKGLCYWSNFPMEFEELFVSYSPWAPSVDRLDNSKGYVKGNIVLTTAYANRGRAAYKGSDLAFKRKLRRLQREADYE